MESLTGPRRSRIAANVLLQLVILAAIILLVNYVGFTRYGRWDLSHAGRFALSSYTRKVLNSLKKEATIYVYLSPAAVRSPGTDLADDLVALLNEYHAFAKRKLRVETIDPYRDISRARDLQERFKLSPNQSVLIFEYLGRSRIVPVTDLADYGAAGLFDDQQEVRAFKGEQVITSALLALIEDKQSKIGFLTGHGEPSIGPDSPLSKFLTALRSQNFALDKLSLTGVTALPPDLSAVVIAGPRYDLAEDESALLRKFWDQQGRLFILLDPRAQTPRLKDFLASLGVVPDHDLLVTKMKTGVEERSVTLDVYSHFLPETFFLKPLAQVIGYFPGGTTSLSIDRNKLAQLNITATRALVPAIDPYWGEKDDFGQNNSTPTYHSGVDRSPPLVFGWALEKGSIQDQRMQVRSLSRMVVVGNADFLRDETLLQGAPELDFALLSINWLTDREQLLAIPIKEPHTYVLRLRPGQLTRIVFLVVVGLPLMAAAFGIAIWVVRRR